MQLPVKGSMMKRPYIHVLTDPDPMGLKGQLICDECKLVGEERLEGWENFLNGKWVESRPDREGFFPVLLGKKRIIIILEARRSKTNESWYLWVDKSARKKTWLRWSLPLPQPPITGEN